MGAIDLIFARSSREVETADSFRVWNGDALAVGPFAHSSSTGDELRALLQSAFGATRTQLDITPVILKLLTR